MKKLIKIIVLTTTLLVCSCGSNGVQQNKNNGSEATYTEQESKSSKHYSYRLLEKHNGYSEDTRYGMQWCYDNGNSLKGLAICYGDASATKYVMFDDEENYYNNCIYEWTLALRIANRIYGRNEDRYTYYVKEKGRIEENENLLVYEDTNSSSDVLYRICPNGDTAIIFYPRITYLYRDSLTALWERQTIDPYAVYDSGDTLSFGDTIPKYYYKNDKEEFRRLMVDLLNFVYCMPYCIEEYGDKEIVEIFKKTYYDYKEEPIYEPEKGYGYRKYPILDPILNDFVYVELYRIKEGEYINVPGGALGIRFSLL